MPLYDFKCSQCDFIFERKLSMLDYKLPETEPCPKCDQTRCITQIISAPVYIDAIRLGVKRPDASWGEVLSKVKSSHPGADWNNKKFIPQSGM